MSIETLLEAAKFLELQAQQQKAREDELREKQRLEELAQRRASDLNCNSTIHINNASKAVELRAEYGPVPVPAPPSLSPPSMPVTVIPIPVVTPNNTISPAFPVATLSPPAAPPPAATLPQSPQSKPDNPVSSVLSTNHKTLIQNNHHQHPQLIAPTNNSKPQQHVQRYPGSIVSPPLHHQQQQQQQHTLLPQTSPVLQQAPLQNGPISRGSPPDDGRHLDSKRRSGGRAHLKECFETLKKNIPNVDEKKTSNLSVLRSALRYIQTLKRKEKDYEHDMERLAREKIATQQRLAELKNELSQWMDVIEIDRVLRQTVQPEEDQASTSTASEGEDVMDDEPEEEVAPRAQPALATVPPTMKPDQHQPPASTQSPTPAPSTTSTSTTTSFITQHISIQQKPPLQPLPVPPPQPTVSKPAATTASAPLTPPQPLIPTQTQMVSVPSLHPTVIAHASVSHPSVIQTVNHVIQGGAAKHIAHLAPSTTTSSVQLAPGHQPIGHITVHPVAHLSQHLPTLYSQPVAVTQSAVVGHITHTINHAHPQMNGTVPSQSAAALMGKQAAVSTQMVAHHPQLVSPAVLNPVTMVTMPSFPISTLKLA
ncbi:uncharacterized protein V6R79_009792 [Siganus canaliculatus]